MQDNNFLARRELGPKSAARRATYKGGVQPLARLKGRSIGLDLSIETTLVTIIDFVFNYNKYLLKVDFTIYIY